jgi:hypothetical protein
VIDDCSEDDSINIIQKKYPDIEILRQPVNTKNPNKLRNIALNLAKTEYVVITDNDIVFSNDCLINMLKTIQSDSNIATVSPRLMYMSEPERIYFAGTKVHYIGAAICDNRDEIPEQINYQTQQNSGSGILLCDRKILLKSGCFDDRLQFAWGDDGMLYQRLLRYGYKCIYEPSAVAYHELKPFTEDRRHRIFGQTYNRAVFILSQYALKTIILILPMLILYEIVQVSYCLIKGYIFRFILANLKVLADYKYIYQKRKTIQSKRKVGDREVLYADRIYMFKSHFKDSLDKKLFNMLNSILNWYWRKIYKFLPFIIISLGV